MTIGSPPITELAYGYDGYGGMPAPLSWRARDILADRDDFAWLRTGFHVTADRPATVGGAAIAFRRASRYSTGSRNLSHQTAVDQDDGGQQPLRRVRPHGAQTSLTIVDERYKLHDDLLLWS
jgi:hypothetical protein